MDYGKLSVTIDNAFSNYILYRCADMNGVQNAIQITFGVKIDNPVRLPLSSVPKRLLHFRIELLPDPVKSTASPNILFKDTHTTCYGSTYTLTANASFSDCDNYSMTYYVNPPAYTEFPIITSLSHATINAGDQKKLTIWGLNFGKDKGKVQFRSADDGGQTFLKDLDDQYYVSWSATKIEVIVPSIVYKGYQADPKRYRGGAGTGKIQVETKEGRRCQSPTSLTIPRSFMNTGNPADPTNFPFQRPYLAKLDCEHDIVFTLHTSVEDHQQSTDVIEAIEAALSKWSSLLGISIALERDTTGALEYAEGAIGDNSTKNLIYFSANGLQATDMMAANNHFPRVDAKYYLGPPSNIQIRPTSLWSYRTSGSIPESKISFYQAFLHEVGHILLLQHVNDASNLMYYETPYGSLSDIYANSTCVQTAANVVALSKNVVWHNWQNKGLATLGAELEPLTVSVKKDQGFEDVEMYWAIPKGGFPPYKYLWDSPPQGGGPFSSVCSIPSHYAGSSSIPVSICSGKLRVTVTDACGAKAVVTITPKKSAQAYDDDFITVYPNPATDRLSISAPGRKIESVALFNQLEQRMKEGKETELQIGDLPAGLYILRIKTDKETVVRKVVKRQL